MCGDGRERTEVTMPKEVILYNELNNVCGDVVPSKGYALFTGKFSQNSCLFGSTEEGRKPGRIGRVVVGCPTCSGFCTLPKINMEVEFTTCLVFATWSCEIKDMPLPSTSDDYSQVSSRSATRHRPEDDKQTPHKPHQSVVHARWILSWKPSISFSGIRKAQRMRK